MQAQARLRGIELDVGEMPDADEIQGDGDPSRAVRLTAHAIARLADRVPFSRRISRHMEGTEARAGIVSDILALIAELARRNPEIIERRVTSFSDDLQRARTVRANRQAAQTQPEGNTHAA